MKNFIERSREITRKYSKDSILNNFRDLKKEINLFDNWLS